MIHKLPLARLGVVGGGQLARMLAPACNAHNVSLTILDPEPLCPAGQVSSHQIEGALHDPAALGALCDDSDIITFDLEDVGADILMTLSNRGKKMVPSPKAVQLIQNKFKQKKHFQTYEIPTSPFIGLSEAADFSTVQAFGLPCVQKANIGGYDGRGVHVIRSKEDWSKRLRVPTFIEEFVPNSIELAVMVACRASGEMVSYDPVEMVVNPKLNLLDYLLAPARIDLETAKKAQLLAEQTVRSFGTAGLFGVEFFLTGEGDLLVNEIAPRAHNSGNHTIEACVTSQFENQLRACLDLPLGSTKLRGHALTINLVGEEGFSGAPMIDGLDALCELEDVHVHLYGKSHCRPGRKMGHVTLIGVDSEMLISRLQSFQNRLTIRGEYPL